MSYFKPVYSKIIKPCSKKLTLLGGYILLLFVLIIHKTCKFNIIADPRSNLKKYKIKYCYATLHSHQISLIIQAEPETASLVSESPSGELLIPLLQTYCVIPIRGSTRREKKHEKKGQIGLRKLIHHALSNKPTYFVVDGPIGPRGYVQKGISQLVLATHATILTLIAVPTRRWFVKSWDRLQIPKPFTTINYYFDVITPEAHDNEATLRKKIHLSLAELEKKYDPLEYIEGLKISQKIAQKRNKKFRYLDFDLKKL